ncbi:MAG TPA: sterol desaturase family protein [Allosphingosinicella sp.]|nr:sterol desaturase family protein [Allosphingosinicella sp.]
MYRIGPRRVDGGDPRAYFAAMVEHVLARSLIVAATVVAMEAFAAAFHRRVMHGWGWRWHRSHHEPRSGLFETNDLYALAFAGLSLLFFTSMARLWPPLWWVGAGMLVYGLLYALLHDGLAHGRLGFRAKPGNAYLKRLVQAHRLHHAVKGRTGAVSFGFLYAPPVRRLRSRLRAGRRAA